MRRLTNWLGGLLLSGACAAVVAAPDALDALQQRATENPRQALQALGQLQDPPAGDARRRYVEALLRLRNGESLEQIATDLPPGSAAAFLLRAQSARLAGQAQEGLAMSGRALQALAPGCGALLQGTPPTRGNDCDQRLAFDALMLELRGQRDIGELLKALAAARNAQALAQSLGDARRQAQALAEEVQLQLRRDEVQLARQRLSEAMALVQGQPLAQAHLLLMEAQLARTAGALAAQRRALEEGLALARQHDAPALVVLLQGNLADHFLLADEPQRAQAMAEAALAQPDVRREVRHENHLRHNLAVALIRQQQFEAARQQLLLQAQLVQADTLPVRERAEQLRELDQAWTAAAQWQDALRAYHAERELSQQANEREREAGLATLRSSGELAQREAELALLREKNALSARALQNQLTVRWIVVLAGLLLGLGLAVGLMMWLGSQAAHRRLRRSQAQLHDLSARDALTQLANRRAFQMAMQARGELPLEGALLLIDIDHFKRINDGHGHAAGDAVLQAVAQRLASQVRQSDMLVRWGGEEFLLYCPSIAAAPLRALVQRLLRALETTPVAIEGELTLSVSASIGFASFPLPPHQPGFGWEQAVNWVDMALYHAKHAGRARGVGIVAAQLPDATAVAQVEADFGGAAAAARIELITLRASDL